MRFLNIAALAVLFGVIVPSASARVSAASSIAERTGQSAGYDSQLTERERRDRAEALPYIAGLGALVVGGLVWALYRAKSKRVGDNVEAAAATARPDPPPSARNIFISYRRDDSADITGRISDRLVERYGKSAVFKDVDSIPIGRDFRMHLRDAVGRCDALLVIIGRQWCDATAHGKRRLDDSRDHLRIEIESALERDIPVIPVLVQSAPMPEAEELPESLRSLAYRNGVLVRPDPDFNGDLDRLIRGIEAQFDGSRSA